MKTRIVGVLLIGAVALLALSTEALAYDVGEDISMRYAGSYTGGIGATGKYATTADANSTTSSLTVGSGGGGLIKFQDEFDSSYFYAFCIELVETAEGSYQPYDVVWPEDAPADNNNWGSMGADGEAALNELFGTSYFNGMAPGDWTRRQAYGFQLAIWEIVYEYTDDNTFTGTLDIDSGDFFFSATWGVSGDFLYDARAYGQLALDAMSATSVEATAALTNPDYQDYLLLRQEEGDDPASPVVPLPPAALGGLLLLGGLAAGRRRRKIRAE